MNRRSFLRFLGLAPVLPIALKLVPEMKPTPTRIVIKSPMGDFRRDLEYATILGSVNFIDDARPLVSVIGPL